MQAQSAMKDAHVICFLKEEEWWKSKLISQPCWSRSIYKSKSFTTFIQTLCKSCHKATVQGNRLTSIAVKSPGAKERKQMGHRLWDFTKAPSSKKQVTWPPLSVECPHRHVDACWSACLPLRRSLKYLAFSCLYRNSATPQHRNAFFKNTTSGKQGQKVAHVSSLMFCL